MTVKITLTQGITRHLGWFKTAEEAHDLYLKARESIIFKGNLNAIQKG